MFFLIGSNFSYEKREAAREAASRFLWKFPHCKAAKPLVYYMVENRVTMRARRIFLTFRI